MVNAVEFAHDELCVGRKITTRGGRVAGCGVHRWSAAAGNRVRIRRFSTVRRDKVHSARRIRRYTFASALRSSGKARLTVALAFGSAFAQRAAVRVVFGDTPNRRPFRRGSQRARGQCARTRVGGCVGGIHLNAVPVSPPPVHIEGQYQRSAGLRGTAGRYACDPARPP